MANETRMIGPAKFRALLGLLFVSGASSLMFEIIWMRAIGLHFGTTTPGISTVLAAFMAGLATGNWLFGPRADRHPRPVHLYRLLELGIGLGGLVISLLLLKGGALLAVFARAIAATGGLQTPLRFLLFFILLLVPTTLMGGTLPVLSRALVRAGDRGAVVGASTRSTPRGPWSAPWRPIYCWCPTSAFGPRRAWRRSAIWPWPRRSCASHPPSRRRCWSRHPRRRPRSCRS